MHASQILWVSILNREHEKLSLQKVFLWWINLLWKIQIECLVWVLSLFWGILYRNWTLILTCYNQHPLHLRICFNQLYLKFHTDKPTLTCTLANKMITRSCWNIIQFFHDWISFGFLQKTSIFNSKNNGWMRRRSKWITFDEQKLHRLIFWRCLGYNRLL